MNRILQITIAFLICTGAAWGQYDFMMGDSATPGEILGVGKGDHAVFDTSITHYTAIGADTVKRIILFFRSNNGAYTVNMAVAIYEWNTTADSATARVYVDTIIGTHSSTGGKDTVNVNRVLTAGKTYTIAFAPTLDTTTGAFYGALSSKYTSGMIIGRYRTLDNPGAGLTDPYPWSGLSTTHAVPQFYALGVFGAAGPAPTLRIGPTAIGVTKLAPPQ